MPKKEKKKSIFSNVFFQIYLIGVIVFIFSEPFFSFRRREASLRYKACYSKIRVLMGAVEMYNMDNETMMTTLDQNTLIKEKYLKETENLVCPERSDATYSGENLTGDGEIICSYHGGVTAKGPYDKELEIENSIVNSILHYLGKIIIRIPGALLWPVALAFFLLRIIP